MADAKIINKNVDEVLSKALSKEKLAKLSEEEKEVIFNALQNMAGGNNKLYNDLRYADYREIPVDILTFIDDYNYLGAAWHDKEGNTKLYPYWRGRLTEIFPDNLTTNYNNAIFSGARGLGKTEIAVTLCLYMMYRVMCLKDPREYYGLKPTETIAFAFMNITKKLVEDIGLSKFQETVQLSPWFMERGSITGVTNKIWNPPDYINIILGSQSKDVIGQAILFCLDGDTVIATAEGDKKIKDCVGLGIRVYSINADEDIVPSDTCTVYPTTVTDEEYQIELENGSIIKCTANHKLMLKDGSYKEAKDLTSDDELVNFKHYEYIYKNINLANNEIYIGQRKKDTLNGSAGAPGKFTKQDLDRKEERYIQHYNSAGTDTACSEETAAADLIERLREIKIKSVTEVKLDEPKQYYDVINAGPYNNFLVKTGSDYIVSHNCFLDEISFLRNKDVDKQKTMALDMVNTAVGGMKTRFVRNGKDYALLVLASSKRSDQSFLETYIKKKVESDGENLFLVDEPVWKIKPRGTYSDKTFKVAVGNKFLVSQIINDPENLQIYRDKGYVQILDVPVDFKSSFTEDIDRALCDFAGISASELSKYISGEAWAATRDDNLRNPFVREILEIGTGDEDADVQYCDFFDMDRVDKSMMSRPLYVHLDLSTAGDKTGISGVWIKSKKLSNGVRDPSEDLSFQLAFAVSIKAPKGRQISYDKHRKFLYWLRNKGFNIKGVSCFTGETLIKTPNGNIKIKDIKPGDIIYSYDELNNSVIEVPVEAAINNGLKDTFIEIALSNEEIIKCTPEHPILTVEGYVEAKDINIDTGIRAVNNQVFRVVNRQEITTNPEYVYDLTVNDYHNFILKNGVIVHNCDTFQSTEMQQYLISHGFPYKTISMDRVERAGDTYVCRPYQYFRNCINENRITTFRQDLLTDEIIELERNINTGKIDHPQGGCVVGSTKISLCDGRALTILDIIEELNEGVKNYTYSVDPKTLKIEPDLIINAFYTKKDAQIIEVILSNGESIRCTPDHRFMLQNGTYKEAQYLSTGEILKAVHKQIIRVASIRFLDEEEDVYDITTEKNHNFALSSDIFIHNSKDVADATVGALYNASQNAEQFAYDFGESIEEFLAVNGMQSAADAATMNADFEQALHDMNSWGNLYKPDPDKKDADKGSGKYSYPTIIGDIMTW